MEFQTSADAAFGYWNKLGEFYLNFDALYMLKEILKPCFYYPEFCSIKFEKERSFKASIDFRYPISSALYIYKNLVFLKHGYGKTIPQKVVW